MGKDFKDFILRGNVVDLAVGIIIGPKCAAIRELISSGGLTPGQLHVPPQRVLLEARRAVRGAAPSGRLERLLHLLAGLLIAGGWVPTFLASRPWVYSLM